MKFKLRKKRQDIVVAVPDDAVSDRPVAMRESFAKLQSFGSAQYTESLLRQIPSDMAEALEMEPAIMFKAVCRLHTLMSHWTTRLSVATGRYLAAKAAKEIGLEAAKTERRAYLARVFGKTTEPQVKERAMATDEYAELCYLEVQARTDQIRIQGLVEAIATKKEALKILSFFARHEVDAAGVAYSNDFQAYDTSGKGHTVLSQDASDSLQESQAVLSDMIENNNKSLDKAKH